MSDNQAEVTFALNRRTFLSGLASVSLGTAHLSRAQSIVPEASTAALKRAALDSKKILGTYTVFHELWFDAVAAKMIANTFSMIADGNDLKLSDRLRPAPDTFDFTFGDKVIDWAEAHKLLFRGHCLVWWNALPGWFQSYVTTANAQMVLTNHITTVVKHYAGRVYAWDVVNEALHNDGRPDYLKRKPWLDLLGPEYIDLAFHTAAEADGKARLVLNQCFVEHDTAIERVNRAALLGLATRLTKAKVPIHAIGLQGHLRGATPLDHAGMTVFLKQVQDIGLEIMITELDVDDVDVPAPLIQETVASKYAEFLDLVGPFAKVITLEALRNQPSLPKRGDGIAHSPNLFDEHYQPTPAYWSTVQALAKLAKPNFRR